MPYELWDLETGNCLGTYPDEGTALTEVGAGIDEAGREVWADVGLLRRGDDMADTVAVAEGGALIARALTMHS